MLEEGEILQQTSKNEEGEIQSWGKRDIAIHERGLKWKPFECRHVNREVPKRP